MVKQKHDYAAMIGASLVYNRKQHTQWDTNIKCYRGEVTAIRNKALPQWQHIVEVNLCRPVVDAMIPAVIFGNPKINLRPAAQLAPEQVVAQAFDIENKMNAIQTELDMATEFCKATKDAVLLGLGFVKYGMSDEVQYDDDRYSFIAPFIKRVSPWDFMVDPACRCHSLDDADYVIFRTIVPIEQAKKDKQLSNIDKMQPSLELQDVPTHIQEPMERARLAGEYVALYEIWHKDGTFAVCDSAGVTYREEKEWPYPQLRSNGLFPVTVISFNNIPELFYSPGEPEFIYMLQLEASEKRTQQLNHTRRFNRKYRVSQDTPDDSVEALRKGDDGTVVRSNQPIDVIADANLSVDVYREYEMIWNELKEVTGISAYQRGSSESGVYSATAARMMDAAAGMRVEEKRGILARAIARGAKIFYSIYGPLTTPKWPNYPFLFNTDVSSMQRPDDEGKRAQLIQFGQIAREFPEFRADAWLRDVAMAFYKQPHSYLLTPEEMQQKQQQGDPKLEMEIARMQMELQKSQMQLELQAQKNQIQMQQAQLKLAAAQNKAQTNAQIGQTKVATAAIGAEQADAMARLVVSGEKSKTDTAAIKAEEADAKARIGVASAATQAAAKQKGNE